MSGLPCRLRRVGSIVTVLLLLAVAICGCSTQDTLGGYKAARTLHLAPDGRLIVADQGTGKHDGAVVAVDTVSHKRTVLLQICRRPMTAGRPTPTLLGPAGRPWPPTGPSVW